MMRGIVAAVLIALGSVPAFAQDEIELQVDWYGCNDLVDLESIYADGEPDLSSLRMKALVLADECTLFPAGTRLAIGGRADRYVVVWDESSEPWIMVNRAFGGVEAEDSDADAGAEMTPLKIRTLFEENETKCWVQTTEDCVESTRALFLSLCDDGTKMLDCMAGFVMAFAAVPEFQGLSLMKTQTAITIIGAQERRNQ
ncbi:MAG: hypothetical protein F4X81_09160 [Gammaproteobacteria bacterium]|nr:hypothetical protein [Gammaproteobacteria bacterium]MYE51626.1 hypothetical protein [Gammaproteobacteria bacterium]MYK28302.1 hypothetical protein [Gammaproteobacteria bacterium]